MTTLIAKRTPKAVKTVLVIARYQFKADSRKVVYLVRGSKEEQYETYFYDGRATSCTCPARKPCYHMIQLEAREAVRYGQAAQAQAFIAHSESKLFTADEQGEKCYSDVWGQFAEEVYEREEIDVEAIAAVWIDEEYEAWKRDNDLDGRLTREEYVAEFAPDGWV